jgi:hypothetical protein
VRNAHRGGVICVLYRRAPPIVLKADHVRINRTVHGRINRIQNSFAVFKDVIVPKTDNFEALPFQPLGPRFIPCGSASARVLRSIDLDHEAQCETGKVSNIWPYRHLTAKVRAGGRQLAKHFPQSHLCARRIGAKPARDKASRCLLNPRRGHRSPHPARFASDPPPPGRVLGYSANPPFASDPPSFSGNQTHGGSPSQRLMRAVAERLFC